MQNIQTKNATYLGYQNFTNSAIQTHVNEYVSEIT